MGLEKLICAKMKLPPIIEQSHDRCVGGCLGCQKEEIAVISLMICVAQRDFLGWRKLSELGYPNSTSITTRIMDFASFTISFNWLDLH